MRYFTAPIAILPVLALPLVASVTFLLSLPPAAAAQEEEPPAEEAAPAEAVGGGAGDATEEGSAGQDLTGIETGERDLKTIESLLEQDESVLADPDSTYSYYDPGMRRDPFRSLLEARESRNEEVRQRPEGKAGLLIDELVIEGVFELLDGPVAQVQSAREETSYLLRPGDQLWDGDVISITLNEVVFKQVVEDPTALKPFRDVVKRLNP